MQLKMKEAKNIRRLAHEVLLQRSDVETFFVSSLQHVRRELEKQEKQPPTPIDAPAPATEPAAKRQVAIEQLSWRERETVLRLAFAKINNQAQNAHFRALPKHSFVAGQGERLTAAYEAPPLSGLVSGAGKPQLA